MIRSMTGFGRATGEYNNKQISVEIKSVNSKSLDLSIRMPSIYKEYENNIRSMFNSSAVRGKVDLSISMDRGTEITTSSINHELAAAYHKQLKDLSQTLDLGSTDFLPLILRMPDIIQVNKDELMPDEWAFLSELISRAMDDFLKFRSDEGATLQKELVNRINIIQNKLALIEKADPERAIATRERIRQKLDTLLAKEGIDDNRLEQEMIYYLEKIDITEEKKRLDTHCRYFIEVMDNEENQGRKLGFITQEIGREINTIGSKANDAFIQRYVVEMKDELEKIKEQSLNIL